MNFRLEKIKALPILVALLLGLVLIPFIYLLFRAGEKSIPEAVDLLLLRRWKFWQLQLPC
jgi:hypothetical protein